jgi:glycogen(starch) synthase
MAKERENKELFQKTMLFECAWEVCNQVGGIYTVIRSKIPAIVNNWNPNNYFLLGPYFEDQASAVFDPIDDLTDSVGYAVHTMRQKGIDVKYGKWLVTGKPKAILFNIFSVFNRLGEIKYFLNENHYIKVHDEDLTDKVIAFGYCVTEFLRILANNNEQETNIIAHFHEWMAGMPIMDIRRENLPIKTVFTTHATMLGRYLAMNDDNFYGNLPFYNWEDEAKHFNIFPTVQLERAAAHGAHVFTTVSDVTAKECIHLLGRKPDFILPNGLNIQRFEASHEFQNLHFQYKKQINDFTRGHFFQSYSFDLDKTLYFFTSGRFEFHNKGFDLTLEALARLNYKMKVENIDATVVFFLVTKQDYYSINPTVLHKRAMIEEIHRNTEEIERDLGDKLYDYITSNNGAFNIPELSKMISETMELKLRRNVQNWKSGSQPTVVTHNLVNDGSDPVLNFLRASNLLNGRDDKVKIVYHPDFINTTNPLFRMEYNQFVRGCHLGLFPSYYEPWGYTPLECMASGVPSVTSDFSGFGAYVQANFDDCEKMGIYIVNREINYFDAAEQLANIMLRFVKQTRRERISMRNNVEESSFAFDWGKLAEYYFQAYDEAVKR